MHADSKFEVSSPLLSIRALSKRYGAFVALDGVDLDVARGEFVALLGPSGCGKTTTLMSVAGFVEPDAGSILLNGKDIVGLPPDQRNMGVVFQDYALFPHMTVLENIAFSMRMRGVPKRARERRAFEALDQVQLPRRLAEARPSQLSGGQRQRVAVARAMVFDPVLLLMDEPLAALDRRLRQDLQFELRDLQSRIDTTVVYVTHDQEEALVLADRIVVMKDGKPAQIDTPQAVYEAPQSEFVASFLGESNRVVVALPAGRAGEVLVGEHRIEVAAERQVEANAVEALLVIRPERTRAIRNELQAVPHGLPATVRDVAFLGDRLRIELEMGFGGTWTSTVQLNGSEGEHLEAGDDVVVTWRPADARLLAKD